MSDRPWLYFALGATTVLSLGAVTNQIQPLAPIPSDPPLSISRTGITFPDGTVQTTADPRRGFYLTTAFHIGTEPDGYDGMGGGVCADGFHFASMWEILDVSHLRYMTALGYVLSDSGQGPPSARNGWVRTGYVSDGYQLNANSLGDGGWKNCNVWSTAGSDKDGTVARLNPCWQESGDCSSLVEAEPLAAWWMGEDKACNTQNRVWCVEDYPGAGAG